MHFYCQLGVYSILGSHDYGDNVSWQSEQAKKENFQSLLKTHELMGWKLLRNEHVFIEQTNEKIAILGVENWGSEDSQISMATFIKHIKVRRKLPLNSCYHTITAMGCSDKTHVSGYLV